MGFIAITHEYFSTDFWTSDEFSEPQAFLDLLSKAEHTRNTRYSRSKKRFDLDRGQRFTTKKHLGSRWHIGQAKLEKWLGKWKGNGWIDFQLDKKHGIVITLLEYERWIHDFTPDEEETKPKTAGKIKSTLSNAASLQPIPAETRDSDDKVIKAHKVEKEAEVQKVPKAVEEQLGEVEELVAIRKVEYEMPVMDRFKSIMDQSYT